MDLEMDRDNTVIPIRVTRYRCPHCGKSGWKRAQMQEHANACFKDPATKACATCLHDARLLIKGDGEAHQMENLCRKGAREYGTKIVKHCPSWEPKAED